jgi:hypothetical protein
LFGVLLAPFLAIRAISYWVWDILSFTTISDVNSSADLTFAQTMLWGIPSLVIFFLLIAVHNYDWEPQKTIDPDRAEHTKKTWNITNLFKRKSTIPPESANPSDVQSSFRVISVNPVNSSRPLRIPLMGRENTELQDSVIRLLTTGDVAENPRPPAYREAPAPAYDEEEYVPPYKLENPDVEHSERENLLGGR